MMQPCQENSRSFFEKLQSAEGLDLRDNRGKRHDLAVVLVGVTLAVLSNRDGCLSSIHRHLVNYYEPLMLVLGVEKRRPVSRPQLPRILEQVSVAVFDNLIFSHFGVNLNEKERKWLAIDGKELRGSIETGEKRGARGGASRQPRNRTHSSPKLLLRTQRIGSSNCSQTLGNRESIKCKDKFRRIALQSGNIGNNRASHRKILGWIERKSKTIVETSQSN